MVRVLPTNQAPNLFFCISFVLECRAGHGASLPIEENGVPVADREDLFRFPGHNTVTGHLNCHRCAQAAAR